MTPAAKHEIDTDTGGSRGRWRGLRGWRHWAGLLAVTMCIAMVTAACAGASGSTPASSGTSASPASTYAKLLTWAQCMRTHGVPNFPDPDSNGVFNGSNINMQSPQVQSARNACKSLQPAVGQGGSGGSGNNLTQALKYAKCMRAHGIPNFPDPDSSGNFHFGIHSGVNLQSATYHSAQQACQSIMPGLPAGG